MNEEILALMKQNVEMSAKLDKPKSDEWTNLYCVTKKSDTLVGYFNVLAKPESVKLEKIIKALLKSGIVAVIQDSTKKTPLVDDIDL